MRSRDEVLREFPNAQRVLTGERTVWRDRLAPEIKRMADRIRELEAQLADAPPSAAGVGDDGHCVKCGGPFCGCVSGAGVTDTQIEAAAKAHYEHTSGLSWVDANSTVQYIWRSDARIMLTAALNSIPTQEEL